MPDDMKPSVPVGEIRTFGAYGPKYQIGERFKAHNGEWLVEVTLVETNEKAAYRLERLRNDPIAL